MMGNRAFLSPDIEAFVDIDVRLTYEEANNRVNQFISGGENIYSAEIEAVISKNPAVTV